MITLRLLLSAFCFFLLNTQSVFAEPVNLRNAQNAANSLLQEVQDSGAAKMAISLNIGNTTAVTDNNGETIAFVHELEPEGFIVTTADSRLSPVLCYSDKGTFAFEESQGMSLYSFIRGDIKSRLVAHDEHARELEDYSAANSKQWESHFSGETAFKQAEGEVYGPLIKTNWGQQNPFNLYCPIDPINGLRSLTGCASTALSQVCNYWHYPKSLSFSDDDSYVSEYLDRAISIPDDAATLDFPDFATLNRELANISYDGDASDIAMFVFGNAVKLQSNFSSKTTYTYNFLTTLMSFGYSSLKISLDWANDYTLAVSDLSKNMPVGLALRESETGLEHAAILDGYDENTGLFHVNMGYFPSYNIWYDLPGIDQYDTISTIIYNIVPYKDVALETVSGTVIDSAGDPVASAKVRLSPGDEVVVTDENGAFSFMLPTSENKMLTVWKPGHANTEYSVDSDNVTVTLETASDQTYAWYRFDSDALDASGKGHDLIADNGVTTFEEGKFGEAARFICDDFMTARDHAFYYPGSGDMTIEFWLNISSLFDEEDTNTYRILDMDWLDIYYYAEYKDFVIFYTGIDGEHYSKGLYFSDESLYLEWVNIVAVYRETGSLSFYANGKLVNTSDAVEPVCAPLSKGIFGLRAKEEKDQEYSILLDELRFSTAALQPGEFVGGGYKGDLTVTVLDSDEDSIVSDATVTLTPGGYSGITDAVGTVTFSALPVRDDYTVTVTTDTGEIVKRTDIAVPTDESISLTVDTSDCTDVEDERMQVFALGNPFPNPFNAGITVNYSIAEEGPVTLRLYNIAGQEVMTVLDESLSPGVYANSVETDHLPNGLFFLKLSAGPRSDVKKIMHVK